MELAEYATDGTQFPPRIPTLLKAARNHFFSHEFAQSSSFW
jgi:hypothetical protein